MAYSIWVDTLLMHVAMATDGSHIQILALRMLSMGWDSARTTGSYHGFVVQMEIRRRQSL
jgi:hypothetical protein